MVDPDAEHDIGDDVPGVARGDLVLLAERDRRQLGGQLELGEHLERGGDLRLRHAAADRDVRDEGPLRRADLGHERRRREPAPQPGDPRRVPAHLEVDDGRARGERARRADPHLDGVFGRDRPDEAEHVDELLIADVDGRDQRDVRVDAPETGAAERAPQAVDLARRVPGDGHGDEQAAAGRRSDARRPAAGSTEPWPVVTPGGGPGRFEADLARRRIAACGESAAARAGTASRVGRSALPAVPDGSTSPVVAGGAAPSCPSAAAQGPAGAADVDLGGRARPRRRGSRHPAVDVHEAAVDRGAQLRRGALGPVGTDVPEDGDAHDGHVGDADVVLVARRGR